MRLTGTAFVIAAAALLVACGDVIPATTSAEPVVRDSAGITILENRAPAWSDGEGLRLSSEPVLRIGMMEGPEEYQLYDVAGARRLADGSVAVLDASQTIRFFDERGNYFRTVGGEGAGPGEFTRATALHRLAGDSLLVWDGRARRPTVLSPDGSFARSIPTDGTVARVLLAVHPSGAMVTADGTGYGEHRPGEGGVRAGVPLRGEGVAHRISPNGSRIDTIAQFRGPEHLWIEADGRTTLHGVHLGADTHFAAGPGGLLIGDSDRYEIRIHDAASGELVCLIRRAVDPRPVDDAAREAARARLAERIEATVAADVPPWIIEFNRRLLEDVPFAATAPAFVELRSDARGRIWARQPVLDDGPATGWDVFDEESRWLGTVGVPEALTVLDIGEDHLVGVVRDELDVEHIHVYRLLEPDRP